MFGIEQIIAYTLALGIAAAIPGPGMMGVFARSISQGFVMGVMMVLGMILGDVTYLCFAVLGLSIIAQSFHGIFIFIKFASAAYLLYLAWCFWNADTKLSEEKIVFNRRNASASFLSGLTITLGNPKTIAFYMAILPVVIDLNQVSFHSLITILIPLTAVILLIVGALFVFGAYSIRKLLMKSSAMKFVYRSAASIMGIAAVTMVAR
jgi:threonine/homoserine/homoserine lactone efflux protein